MRWWWSLVATLSGVAAIGAVFALMHAAPAWALAAVLIAMFLLPIAWVFISALFPVVEDRNCPACGEWALKPLSPTERYGVRCEACGHEDPSIPGARIGHEPPASGGAGPP